MMPKAWAHMLDWLKIAYDDPTYGEEQLEIKEVSMNVSNGNEEEA